MLFFNHGAIALTSLKLDVPLYPVVFVSRSALLVGAATVVETHYLAPASTLRAVVVSWKPTFDDRAAVASRLSQLNP